MSTRIAIAALVTLGALSLGAAEPRNTPIERFAAASPVMTSAARLTLRPVEIAITRWSTHHGTARARDGADRGRASRLREAAVQLRGGGHNQRRRRPGRRHPLRLVDHRA